MSAAAQRFRSRDACRFPYWIVVGTGRACPSERASTGILFKRCRIGAAARRAKRRNRGNPGTLSSRNRARKLASRSSCLFAFADRSEDRPRSSIAARSRVRSRPNGRRSRRERVRTRASLAELKHGLRPLAERAARGDRDLNQGASRRPSRFRSGAPASPHARHSSEPVSAEGRRPGGSPGGRPKYPESFPCAQRSGSGSSSSCGKGTSRP